MKKPELLSPIQDFISLQAAIDGGCDAVYFGIRGFNMRAGAKNFAISDLKKISGICKKNGVKNYLALNTIIYENELRNVDFILKKAKLAGISAVICWDLAVVQKSVKMGIETHLSTQASVANSEAAEFYRKLGIKRIILARECSLEQIKEIKDKSKMEIEVFIHGAMCVSISGRCFLSQFLHNKSANRGECLQPCRRKYLIKQIDTADTIKNEPERELEIGEDYVLSPKDLCTLLFIEKLINAGVDCFKIEGRNRNPEYVKTVTSAYRRVIDYYWVHLNTKTLKHLNTKTLKHLNTKTLKHLNTKTLKHSSIKLFEEEFILFKKELMEELKTVYNRGFGNGFYLGKPLNEWTHSYGSQAVTKKVHIGKVVHYYPKIKVVEVEIQAKKILKAGDNIVIEGPTTGVYEKKVESMEINHKKIKKAEQGDLIAIKLDKRVRVNDLVYKIVNKY